MENLITIAIIIIILAIGIIYTINHFKGRSGCCGNSGAYISKKKLKKVIAKKTFVIEGMTCENCVARILRYVNDIEGVAGKIDLKKKTLTVSMEKEVSDQVIIDAIIKAGYHVK